MLKFQGKFKKGDYIRAYDFEPCRGRKDSYIEGTIVEEHTVVDLTTPGDYSYFLVDVDVKVWSGEYQFTLGERVRVPMETSMDYDHRIIEV